VSYLVLARKYRPQSFDDLVGQEHIARTLANAIASGRVAHAFLFTGVRGVGKTTSARLLAKCLNCLGADGSATGPTSAPCQVCAACKEIAGGSDMDVQEIDGASYNGVDEVRRLQEGLAFRPARDRFKIYIVDEVHMLSNAAWNAFLKTLEEPPPHVKFIFATTEVHKVPVTILSRCQRYDFKLIGTSTIAKRLHDVLALEKIAADDEAVSVIAREAAGSMRDAMSLIDQVIAFSGEKLTGEDVARVLGVADRKVLHDLATALVQGDAGAALRTIDGLAQQGYDLPHVARDVMRHLRNLVVAKVCGEEQRAMLELADEESKDVFALAAAADADDLTRLYQGFSRGFDEVVKSGQPRAALEMLLVRLARRPPLLPLDELLARLGELERRLAGGAPPPPRGGPTGAGPGGGGRAPSPSPQRASMAAPTPFPIAMPGASTVASAPRTDGALALAAPPAAPHEGPRVQRAPELAPVPSAPPARAPSAAPAPPSSSARAIASPEAGVDPSTAWRAILDRVRAVRPPLASVLEHAVPISVDSARVALAYDAHSFLGTQASDPEALALLRREAQAHFGAPTDVTIDLSARSLAGQATVAIVEAERRKSATAEARAQVERHPLVREAIALFGAELRDVRLPPEE